MISGNPAVFILNREVVYIVSFLIFFSFWLKKPLYIHKESIYLFCFFIILLFIHLISFGSIVLMSSIGFLLKLGIAFLTVRLIPDFFEKYINILFYLAVISLAFYIPTLLGINMEGVFSFLKLPLANSDISHIGIHNFQQSSETRNSGLFWEPGAFAGYLVLALYFIVIGTAGRVKKWKIITLIIALLTTQSTTGYLAGFILLVFWPIRSGHMKQSYMRIVISIFVLGGIVLIAFIVFHEFSFLGEKIAQQIENALIAGKGYQITRFGNFIYDLQFIAQRPFGGWGANPETRFYLDSELAEFISGQGNGLTGFAVKFGLIALIIYFTYLYRGLRFTTQSSISASMGCILISLLLMGEQFLNFPIFLALAFLPQNKKKVGEHNVGKTEVYNNTQRFG